LIEDNGYSIIKINNAAYKTFKLALWELSRYPLTSLKLFDLEWLNRNKSSLFLNIEKSS